MAAASAVAHIKTPIVLFFGNVAGMQGELAALAGRERTVFGFPGVGGRLDGSVVRSVQIRQQPTTLGAPPAQRELLFQVARALRSAGFGVSIVADMAAWLDAHAAFIVPITAAVRTAGDSADALSRDPALLRLMVRATRETYGVLARLGRLTAPLNLRLLYRVMPVWFACRYWRRALQSEFGELAFVAHTRHAWPEFAALAKWVEEWFREAPAPAASGAAFHELIGLARQHTRATG